MPTDKHSHARKKDKPSRKLARKAGFSKTSLLIFCVIFAAIGAYIIWRSFAAPPPPTVYISPASQVLAGSASFSVQIRENSGATPVNAVQANFTYDSSLLTFVGIDYTASAFGTPAQSSGGGGIVNIGRGSTCNATCATLTGDQLIATVNFTAKITTGSAAMAFTSGTALVSSGGNADILSGLGATGGATFSIDATSPTAAIISPSNNATLAQGNTINVSANATDTGSSVSKVEFYIDGVLASTDSASPYAFSWNTTGLALGSHTIQAKSYDSVNNITTSSLITVTLADQTAPSSPASFRTTGSGTSTINLAWNTSTDNIAVASYRLSRNGTQIATMPAGTLSYNDTGLSPSTTYNYSLVALDTAGNTSAAATLSSSTSSPVPGDTNNDGHVDIVDLSTLLTNFGKTTASCDFNHDGVVDVIDLSTLLTHYGV